ncbi:DUF2529 family protein [Lysinibacillus odysseyi]|uniref:DUF2529 domain-containing protein n=1 Tax=Lysinibacillus odysseyi 34hs-1 = NBRC 100172 TaxID=1220589 RepID=A0A0A3JF97_9BACI|nr:DUF2529 family protein [Lysinibacillus odysseyi]KGR85712.1 hypothetical protein CD32_07605 [Lysinibacillus odysseyi 34hs-1 = NBRC 100172]
MSKILTTQMTGLLQRIQTSEEEAIEDTARLLAQAGIGQGNVYFACFGELKGVEINALEGAAPFIKAVPWSPEAQLTEADRVIIFTRSCQNEEAVALAQKLYDLFIPFAAIASEPADSDNELSELAYTYISMKIRGGILPHPSKLGERVVFPHLMAALFIYEAIKMEYDEMVADDEEDEEPPVSPFA